MADSDESPPAPNPPEEESDDDFDDLKKRAKSLFFRSTIKLQNKAGELRETDAGGKLQELLRVAHSRYAEARDSETAARLEELARIAQGNATALSDSAAVRVAEIYSESTGKEVAPDQVKKAAVKMGVTALVTTVAFTILRRIPGVNSNTVLASLRKFSGSFGTDLSEFFGDEHAAQERADPPAEDGRPTPPEDMT